MMTDLKLSVVVFLSRRKEFFVHIPFACGILTFGKFFPQSNASCEAKTNTCPVQVDSGGLDAILWY
jgi:hypothetical protein